MIQYLVMGPPMWQKVQNVFLQSILEVPKVRVRVLVLLL